MKKHFLFLLLFLLPLGLTGAETNEETAIEAASDVINRFTGGKMKVNLELSLSKTSDGRDRFQTQCSGGVLTVKGSSGVALCRGFYDYVKSQGAAICSWSGNRFDENADFTDQSLKTVTSPFRDHYYMNVVTHGYSTPYWDIERWDKEIDWMALHGVDMPLVLMAQEAVYRLVFKDLGMRDSEINAWETGPAHLPWMRMGNLAGNSFDGPLTRAWDDAQIDLTKHVLGRMRALGMKPITPAFGGFVPPAFSKYYSGTIDRTGWSWVPTSYRNYRLNPSSSEFVKIGRMFVEKWDSIFGAGKYYLSDSFNEMEVPSDKSVLKQYGDSIYKSIVSANPDATWVMQGWTLGYQRGSWNNGRFEALVSDVPDDRFMMLDMATDYNRYVWGNGWNWDVYPKFYGKEWVWSVIPNMGGKTAMTGRLEHYANGRLEALKSSNKGNLTGYGFAPEGIENNEMIYELLCDGGWTSSSIDVDTWLTKYARARYGEIPAGLTDYYTGLRSSVYNSFTDHPRYGWQTGNYTSSGSVNQNKAYNEGVEALFENIENARNESGSSSRAFGKLLSADLIEAAAFYASGKVAAFCTKINSALAANDKVTAKASLSQLDTLMRRLDAALTCHPLYRLELWEEQAQKMGTTTAEKRKYAKNARRIVSVWYGNHTSSEPVMDYAARVWSGMVRDYYWPRMKTYFENKIYGRTQSLVDVENAFVNAAPSLSEPEPVPSDTIAYLIDLVNYARTKSEILYEKLDVIEASNDYENHWYAIRSGADNATAYVITQQGEGEVLKAQTYTVSGTQMWRFIKSGTEDGVYHIENRFGQNISGTGVQSNHPISAYTSGNVEMKMVLAPDDSKRWFIYPAGQEKQALHVNIAASSQLTTWSTISDDGTEIHSGSTWTLERVDDALVPETTNDDYARYIEKLEALRGTPMNGEAGQVKSPEALEAAIDSLKAWADNIDHSSYNSFLAKWAKLYDDLFGLSGVTAGTRQLSAALVEARAQREKYISEEVGHYPESVAAQLDAVMNELTLSLQDTEVSDETRSEQVTRLSKTLTDFLSKISSASFNMPKESTSSRQYGYRMYTPHRNNRYVTTQGVGKSLKGTTDNESDASLWDFYLRSDNSYDIRNRQDQSYISPVASYNTQLKTSSTRPSKGWLLKKSSQLLEVVIYCGSVQFNQTLIDTGDWIYNWGSQYTNGGIADDGCRYVFESEDILDGIETPLLPTTDVPEKTPYYDLSGRRVVSHPRKGLYVRGGAHPQKVFIK